jgi:hypothetical protein
MQQGRLAGQGSTLAQDIYAMHVGQVNGVVAAGSVALRTCCSLAFKSDWFVVDSLFSTLYITAQLGAVLTPL